MCCSCLSSQPYCLIINKKTTRSGVFGAVILLAGLVTTSFVCNFYALLVFSRCCCSQCYFVFMQREKSTGWWRILIAAGLYLCFIVFYLCYLIYISKGFEPLVAQFSHLIFNAVGQAAAPEYGSYHHLVYFSCYPGSSSTGCSQAFCIFSSGQ